MPYASGRVIHDADAHIMELPGFLEDHLETTYRGRIGDDVLFPRREGFHSHLKEAHRTAAGLRRKPDHARQELGRARFFRPHRTARARSTFWASPASSCSRRHC